MSSNRCALARPVLRVRWSLLQDTSGFSMSFTISLFLFSQASHGHLSCILESATPAAEALGKSLNPEHGRASQPQILPHQFYSLPSFFRRASSSQRLGVFSGYLTVHITRAGSSICHLLLAQQDPQFPGGPCLYFNLTVGLLSRAAVG